MRNITHLPIKVICQAIAVLGACCLVLNAGGGNVYNAHRIPNTTQTRAKSFLFRTRGRRPRLSPATSGSCL